MRGEESGLGRGGSVKEQVTQEAGVLAIEE